MREGIEKCERGDREACEGSEICEVRRGVGFERVSNVVRRGEGGKDNE